ncbi:hypothetical protein JB92DRAFT_2826285 [Gautieria morchelliformis]|nr:hypothetical protein JB92DRAFT_2826285 [Gautieria morchelliformis]
MFEEGRGSGPEVEACRDLSPSQSRFGHRSHPLLKKLNLDPTEPYGDICHLSRGTAVYQLPISVKEHTPMAHSDNPLNPQNAEAVADTFGRMDIDEPSKKMKKSRKKFNSVRSQNGSSLHADMSCRRTWVPQRKLSVVEAHVIGATTHDFAFRPSLVPSAKPIETSHGNISQHPPMHTAQARGLPVSALALNIAHCRFSSEKFAVMAHFLGTRSSLSRADTHANDQTQDAKDCIWGKGTYTATTTRYMQRKMTRKITESDI